MWKRIELHNHTNESDGRMTVLELASFFKEKGICSYSLTDHNTVSGCQKLAELCRRQTDGRQADETQTDEAQADETQTDEAQASIMELECISGCELTTFYGHLLCQNLSSPICWEDLDAFCADPLFERVHAAGGLAGPAHPFSIPSPFSNGMRWTMKIHNPHLIDFVEIINNSHPMLPDNREAILWWEELILSGVSAAAVTGLDLHAPIDLEDLYKTYIFVRDEDLLMPLSTQLEQAIRSCLTCVTKADVLNWELKRDGVLVFFERSSPADRDFKKEGAHICRIRTRERTVDLPMIDGSCFLSFSELPAHTGAILFSVFDAIADPSHLIAVAPPLLLHNRNLSHAD